MVAIDLISSVPFFDSFDQDKLEIIQPFFNILHVKAGETILTQGQFNLTLFYLIEGSIDVFVDDSFVITYQSDGTLIGEMSIAGHTTCSATIVAKTPCQFLTVSWEDLQNKLDDSYKDIIMKLFYKSCSEILAQKLILTNAIAKTFQRR